LSLTKTLAWYGLAVPAVFLLAFALLIGSSAKVTEAAAPTIVNVIIQEGADGSDDNDSIVTATTSQQLHIIADVDDAGGGATNETIVTLTTSYGTFSNGLSSVAIVCALDDPGGVVAAGGFDDNDIQGTDSNDLVGISEGLGGDGGIYNAAAEVAAADNEVGADNDQGCHGVDDWLLLPANATVGSVVITATTLNGITNADVLLITSATAATKVAKSFTLTTDATVISGGTTTVASPDNESIITITTKDVDGKTSTAWTGNVQLTTTTGQWNTAVDCSGTALGTTTVVTFSAATAGTGNLCATTTAAATLGTATITATDIAGTLTAGTFSTPVNGLASAITLTLSADLNTSTVLLATITANAVDAAGLAAADATTVTITAGPATVCSMASAVNAVAMGKDSKTTGTIVVTGAEGNCVIQAAVGSVVSLLAETVGPAVAATVPGAFTGTLPGTGFATVTYTGTIAELKASLVAGCTSGAPVYGSTVVGGVGTLIPYFSTTSLGAPNAAFEAAFAGGLSNTPLIAGNCT